jgi:cellulose synthase/poly-beta-1,6-N-acetylglucosamine synthase-like glycosyltransferase
MISTRSRSTIASRSSILARPMALPARPPERLRSLSAFFPVRDEEDTVVPVAEAILASVSTVADWTEIIIVDDGSRDRTAERADALARTHGSVRVVRHDAGLGYGAAVRTRLAAALAGIDLTSDGAALSAELVMRLVQGGHRIVEIPVHHHPRRTGAASGGRPRVIGRAFAELLRIVLRLRREARARRMSALAATTR